MKKELLASLIVGLSPLTATAQAVFPSAPPAEIRGPYLGASIGTSHNRTGCVGVIGGGGRACDPRDPSFSGFAGYQLNRYFAGEVSYRSLGKVRSSGFGSTFETSGAVLDATVLGRVEVYDRLFAYGRFGGYRAHLDTSVSGVADRINYNFTYGLGLQWELLPQWAVRADWQRYRKVGNSTLYGSSTYDVLSVGALFRFR
jgi:OmpA-OmpF porin, OOP family